MPPATPINQTGETDASNTHTAAQAVIAKAFAEAPELVLRSANVGSHSPRLTLELQQPWGN